MIKKIFISTIILSLLNLIGCYSMQSIPKETLRSFEEAPQLKLHTSENNTYEFDDNSYQILQDSIKGSGILKSKVKGSPDTTFEGSIAIDDVKSAYADQFNVGGTIMLGLVIVGIIVWAANFDPIGDGPILDKF